MLSGWIARCMMLFKGTDTHQTYACQNPVLKNECMAWLTHALPLQQALHAQVCCDERRKLLRSVPVCHHVPVPRRPVEGVLSPSQVLRSRLLGSDHNREATMCDVDEAFAILQAVGHQHRLLRVHRLQCWLAPLYEANHWVLLLWPYVS